MQIVYYPDPVLDKRADPVDPVRKGLREFVREMLETMVEAHGVGLAAPQVGESLRLFVASETGEVENGRVYINPEIEPFGPPLAMEEGCLSLPDM
ncbi:MAG: peptide deformylase, partial [Planctomycetota bacterium]